jgi:hypothetical protein
LSLIYYTTILSQGGSESSLVDPECTSTGFHKTLDQESLWVFSGFLKVSPVLWVLDAVGFIQAGQIGSRTALRPMNQTQINNAISAAFENLSNLNEQLYDYWISELYDAEGDMIGEMWSEETVNEMEKDVMQQSLV